MQSSLFIIIVISPTSTQSLTSHLEPSANDCPSLCLLKVTAVTASTHAAVGAAAVGEGTSVGSGPASTPKRTCLEDAATGFIAQSTSTSNGTLTSTLLALVSAASLLLKVMWRLSI